MMVLWRPERWIDTRQPRQRQEPGDSANDRQRTLARDIVNAVWLEQVMGIAKHALTLRMGYTVTLITPDGPAYDAAERVIVEHDCSHTLLVDSFDRNL